MEKLFEYSKNKMKMILNTDFKTFNKQTNYIGSGNVISNTQHSSYIRPKSELECNGRINEEGVLTRHDLSFFRGLPSEIYNEIYDSNKKCILYEFKIYNKGIKKIVGYMIDWLDGNSFEKYPICYSYESYSKRFDMLSVCEKIIKK